MSRRNWVLHPPIGVGLAIVLMLALAWLHNERNKSYCSKYPSTHYCRYSAEFGRPISLDTKARGAHIDPTEKESREYQAFQAQIDAAEWAMWNAIGTFGTVIVAGVGIFYVRRTLEANRTMAQEAITANKINRETFVSTERPWVFVTDIQMVGEFVIDRGTLRIPLHCEIKNVGRSLALDVIVNVEFQGAGDAEEQLNAIAQLAVTNRDRVRRYEAGVALLPNATSIKDQAAQTEIPTKRTNPHRIPRLLGVVTYTNPLDGMPRQSGFGFEIRRKISDPSEIGVKDIIYFDELPLKTTDLTITRLDTRHIVT